MRLIVHEVYQLDENFGGDFLQWVESVPRIQQREDKARGAWGDDLEGIGLGREGKGIAHRYVCTCASAYAEA